MVQTKTRKVMELEERKRQVLLRWAKDLFRQYARASRADRWGYCRCITCGLRDVHTGGRIQAGHFIHRSNSTYFLLVNCWPQCQQCNGFSHGKPREYAAVLNQRFGADLVPWLVAEGRKPRTYPKWELCRGIRELRINLRSLGVVPCR